MPVLENPRHEAFAQARARGALLNDAYEDAGFAPDRSHANRLAGREDVAERVAELKAELRAEQAGLDGASPHKVIAALLEVAKNCQAQEGPAALKEARLALLDAQRLHSEVALSRQIDRMGWRMDGKI
jgi:hypothetical protein